MRSIPPAPRRIRLRPLLAHRWPLLAVGGGLCVLGSLVAWLMFLQAGGKFADTERLDHGPCAVVTGAVHEVGAPFRDGGRSWRCVFYGFPWQGIEVRGNAFVADAELLPGQTVDIEVLVAEPNVNRIQGAVRSLDRGFLHPPFWFGIVVTPGALILLGWLAGAFQLRHVLVHGDVSVGRVLAVRPVPFVLPQMVRVDYEFRDHRAVLRRHGHWVRVHGGLGARLLHGRRPGGEPLPVLHDRHQPQQNRMLLPEDFLPEATSRPDARSEHGVP
ncbi:MAG: hypothetical protein KF830_11265 [Planctomycetes bacterium]|nr:hypothetical protein [Planctomycetota bacterium]